MRYQKSAAGQQAFKLRSPDFSPRQRSVFLLFDGLRSVDEVLKATAGLGATLADVDDLVSKGFLTADSLAPVSASPTPSPAAVANPPQASTDPDGDGELSEQALYSRAYPIAIRLTASLGLRGFRLNLAVEAASGYHDLVKLLPQIVQAVGSTSAQELKSALRVR